MANPAAELYDIFNGWLEAGNGKSNTSNLARRDLENAPGRDEVLRAMELLVQLRDAIRRLESLGRRVEPYLEAYPIWLRGLLAVETGWLSASNG